MNYAELISYPRSWDRVRYPVLAHIEMEARFWKQFQRAVRDQTQAQVLGHDEGANDLIVAHVACTSDTVCHRLVGRWAS